MNLRLCVRLGLALLVAAFCGAGSQAQQPEFTNNFKYNRGQGVQPIFEGWSARAGRAAFRCTLAI